MGTGRVPGVPAMFAMSGNVYVHNLHHKTPPMQLNKFIKGLYKKIVHTSDPGARNQSNADFGQHMMSQE